MTETERKDLAQRIVELEGQLSVALKAEAKTRAELNSADWEYSSLVTAYSKVCQQLDDCRHELEDTRHSEKN